MFKRLEEWAGHSAERSRLVIILLCLAIGLVMLGFLLILALIVLNPFSDPGGLTPAG